MRRRQLILQATGLTLGGSSLGSLAQTVGAPARIGILSGGNVQGTPDWEAFYSGMRRLGYVEGRDVVYDRRAAAGNPESLSQMARELVATKPKLIVTTGSREVIAARQATSTIPIVMMFGGDPIGTGMAKSLAQPGGNVTGLTRFIPGFVAKALELLRQALPTATRIGVLENSASPSYSVYRKELVGAAASLGLTLLPSATASRPSEIPAALAMLEEQRPQALFVLVDVLFYVNRRLIIEFATRRRLPSMFNFPEDVQDGGLMAFTVEWRELYERAPAFIDKIMKGASPAEIPIEQPLVAGLWINLKTARALGLDLPKTVLLQAQRLIE